MRASDYARSRFDAQIFKLKEKEEKQSEFKPETDAQDWKDNLSEDIDYIIPFECLARDIQQWILKSSMYPQPAIAFAATISVLAVAIGRHIAYENIKGNLMYICMAESGEGKDYPFKCIKRLLEAVDLGDDVYGKMASGAALMESLFDSPSMLFHIDEFGNYMASINGKNSNQYSKEIVDIMTEAYTCSDSDLSGKKLKGKEPIKIEEPNLCVFGLSTERQIFDGLKTSDLANGSIARYSLLFGINGQMPRQVKKEDIEIPAKIIDRLMALVKRYRQDFFIASQQLQVTDEYDQEKFNLVCRIKEKSIELLNGKGDKSAFVPLCNRIALRCVQQAMIIDQCQDLAVLLWLEKLELKSFDVFAKKFLHLGSDNETERYVKRIEKAIKESGKNGITASQLYNSTRGIDYRLRKNTLEELERIGRISVIKEIVYGQEKSVYYWRK
jgi:hypothetical protein